MSLSIEALAQRAWAVLAGSVLAGPVQAQAGPPITAEAIYTADLMGPVRGGLRREAVYQDNLDLTVSADLQRLLGWRGATAYAYVLSNRGDDLTPVVGDAQGVSNIEAPNTWKLYEAWIQQNVLQGRVSILAGLYDLNTEFDAIQAAGAFLNSSFGMGAEYGQSGLNGPSSFPVTSLGLRVKVKPTRTSYLGLAVLDGVPGDATDPFGTHVRLGNGEGWLVAGEAALLSRLDPGQEALTARSRAQRRHWRIGRGREAARYGSKLAVGGWLYTAPFDDLVQREAAGSPLRQRGNRGAYALGEHRLYREGGNRGGGKVFARVGLARADFNRFGTFGSGGVVLYGLIPGRDDDETGLGIAVAKNGVPYRRAVALGGGATDGAEATLELTHRTNLGSWLAVQPDLQWVVNPDTRPDRGNVVVLGVRVEAAVRFP